uniref:Uncharacterized protein n=1 Tax=Anopheles minimus TaxID=112268 RepID=A0A182W8W5_9DIPT
MNDKRDGTKRYQTKVQKHNIYTTGKLKVKLESKRGTNQYDRCLREDDDKNHRTRDKWRFNLPRYQTHK